MKEVRILEIKESVFADNDRQADKLRRELKERIREEMQLKETRNHTF